MRKALATVVVILAAALSTAVAAAAPAGSNVSLGGQADFITAFNTVAYVSASCTGGTGSVAVNIQQAKPPLATGNANGATQVICDGTSRKYAVALGGGPMQLGDAVGAATLTAPSGVATDTGNVRITRPST